MGNPVVAVIGDSCIDIFVYCRANRLAPDIPIPVLERVSESTNPGMAKNVARNLEAIGISVEVFTNKGWEANTKTRFVDKKSNHSFFRLDSSAKSEPLRTLPDFSRFDAIVVSDYNKGFLDEEKIEKILSTHPRSFLDTKKVIGPWASKAYLIKINDFEYQQSFEFLNSRPDIASKVVRTLGGEGAEYKGKLFPPKKVEVLDSSGAGDAFMAALVGSILRNNSTEQAIHYANLKASGVVRTRGVSVIHD